jgi:hypothetical protein
MDDNPKVEKPKTLTPGRGGIVLVLTLGMVAGIAACFFVLFHTQEGADVAEQFGMELPTLALTYLKLSGIAFVFPPAIWAGAMLLTRAGSTQHNSGKMLIVLLFGFALLWPMGAFVAFQRAYDPPRKEHLVSP